MNSRNFETPDPHKSLAYKATRGLVWNFMEQLGRRGISGVITVLLARLLVPEDFGLIAMISVFLAVASSMMDSGFMQALIRMRNAEKVDFNTAFYANLGLGALAYILLFLAAPYIAVFYKEPKLIDLIRVAGLGVLINAFQVVQFAILSRALNFKIQFHATLPAGLISGVIALGMAYEGYGVWTLVMQMLLGSLITTIILWRNFDWRPSLTFSLHSFREMYGFGHKLLLSGLIDQIFTNIYVIVIAKMFTASIAGYYFFASRIKDILIHQLVNSIQTVSFPALAIVQDDCAKLKTGYRNVIAVTTFIVFPVMVFIAALAEPIFELLLPQRWAPAAVYLQLMCLGALLYPLHAINLNILQVKGRSDIFLYLEILKKLMATAILFISYRYGVIGILLGQILGSLLAYIPNSYFSNKLIGYPRAEQISDFMPSLLLALGIGAGIFILVKLSFLPLLAELMILTSGAVVLYALGAHALRLRAYALVKQHLNLK